MRNRDRVGRGRRASVVGLLTILLLALGLPWALAEADCPQLLSPAAGEVMDNGRSDGLDDVVWVFRWAPCDGADAYRLRVRMLLDTPERSSSYSMGDFFETTETEYTFQRDHPFDALWLEGWSWQVQARVGGDWGPWFEKRDFSLEPVDSDPIPDFGPPADCPVPVEPAAGAVLDNGRTDLFDEMVWSFAWTPCPGASAYWLVVLREGAPAAAISQRWIRADHHEVVSVSFVPESDRTGWAWRVRAYVEGVRQPWSVARAFSVEPPDSDPPRVELMTPLPQLPVAGTPLPNVRTFPQMGDAWQYVWARVPNAVGYHLVVTAPHLATPFLDETFDETWVASWCWQYREDDRGLCEFHTGPGAAPLPAGGDWSWRVRARLGAGWGPWSDAAAFTIGPAPGGAEAWIEGRLDGWAAGPARVVGYLGNRWPTVGEGEVAADGSFVVHLPALAFGEHGFVLDTDDGPVGVVPVPVLVVFQEETEAAWVAVLATSFEAGLMFWTQAVDDAEGEATVSWWFAERPAARAGSDVNLFGEDREELALQHGWNAVLARVVEVGGEGNRVLMRTTVAEPPDDVGWYWRSNRE